MPKLKILNSQNEIVVDLVQSAINNERKLINHGINRTKFRLKEYEKKYGFSTKKLLNSLKEDFDDSNLDFSDWIGEYKMLNALKKQKKEVESIKICI